MIRGATAVLLTLTAAPMSAASAVLTLPASASRTFAETLPLSSYRIATGPFADGAVPFDTVEGVVTRRVWQLPATDITALQVLAPLRAQLSDAGFETIFACATRACGGYDFRFDIDVVPAPEMFVDLASFRYLAMRRDKESTVLIVSTSGGMAFVQQTDIVPAGTAAPIVDGPAAPPPAVPGDVAAALTATGHAVLADLDFATGSSDLPGAAYASLAALAGWLRDRPGATVALVGHTDAQGGAEGNLEISRRRAASAAALLVRRYGIDPDRVETRGVGYFAPMARNDTPEGRAANRRVEAVVIVSE